MIQEQLAFSAGISSRLPPPFPLPKSAPHGWFLPPRAKQRFLQAGKAALQTPIAPLPLSLWLDFTHTGRRTPWETAYLLPPGAAVRTGMRRVREHSGRFLDAIADTVWALCEESAWQLPAHNSYIRDTPQLPLPDTSQPIVELFAAETGALLALTRYLLPDELDTAAPGTTVRMEQELNTRILTPYFSSHFWWMGNGAEAMCNWTSWCSQNVLRSRFFCCPPRRKQRCAAVKQAAYSLDCFLKDYGADGCCNEGAQYYRHAGLTLWGCLEILSAVAPQAFCALFHEPKIKKYCGVHLQCPCRRALLPELWRLQSPCRAVRCAGIPFWAGCGQRCFASPCGGRLPRRCRPRPFAEPGRQHPHQPVVPAHHRLCRTGADGMRCNSPSIYPRCGTPVWAFTPHGRAAGCWGKVRLQRRQPQSQRYRQHYCIQGRQTVLIDIGVESYTQKPSAPSGMRSGRCRAHGTTCQPLTACSSCPARNTLPGRCAPRKIASPANWRARTRLSQGLPPTAAVYQPVNRASPCGTKQTIPARWI